MAFLEWYAGRNSFIAMNVYEPHTTDPRPSKLLDAYWLPHIFRKLDGKIMTILVGEHGPHFWNSASTSPIVIAERENTHDQLEKKEGNKKEKKNKKEKRRKYRF
jgi:hypothetical protein